MGAGVSGILDAEPSNGKSSLFQRSSERERKEEREKRGGEQEREERGERDTSASPIPGFQHQKNESNSSAAAAKSLQSCPTLCDPIDGSLPGSPVPGILQARTLEWVAISFFNARK